jgi:hypothetical protein
MLGICITPCLAIQTPPRNSHLQTVAVHAPTALVLVGVDILLKGTSTRYVSVE